MPKHVAFTAVEWLPDEPAPPPAARQLQRTFSAHPLVAELNLLAGELIDVLGPMFWAALIVLSLVARFSDG